MTPLPKANYDMTPPGMVRICPGDVLHVMGGPHICVKANESWAVVRPMSKKTVVVTDKVFDKTVTFERAGSDSRISTTTEPSHIIERRGQHGLDDWLANKKGTLVRLELGDVIVWDGYEAHVVAAMDSTARVAYATGETVLIDRDINDFYLRRHQRLDEQQRAESLNNFLQSNALDQGELNHKPLGEEKDETSMSTSKKNKTIEKSIKNPRGGLAAEGTASTAGAKQKASKTRTGSTGEHGKGALGEWLGHSVTAVLRALGKAGVHAAHARAICAANNIKAADATVSIQTSWGRKQKATDADYKAPADLTEGQLKALLASAEDPKDAKAAAKT